MNVRSMLRGGSGEAFQYAFHGPGFVVVQPSEWTDTAARVLRRRWRVQPRRVPRRVSTSTPPRAEPDPVARLRATWRRRGTPSTASALLGPLARAALDREQTLPAQRVAAASGLPVATLVRLFTLGDAVDEEEAGVPTLGVTGRSTSGSSCSRGRGSWRPATCAPTATRAMSGGSPPTSPSSPPGSRCARTTCSASAVPRRPSRPGPRGRRWSAPSTSAPAAGCRHCTSAATPATSPSPTSPSGRWPTPASTPCSTRSSGRCGPARCSTRRGRAFEHRQQPTVRHHATRGRVPLFEYRDGGAAGDAIVADLVRSIGEHLEPGGIAQFLGNWEIIGGADWRERVRSWVAGTGWTPGWSSAMCRTRAVRRDLGARRWPPQRDSGVRGHVCRVAGRLRLPRRHRDRVRGDHPPAAGDGREPFIDLEEATGPVAGAHGASGLAGLRARTWLAEHTDDEVLAVAWRCAPDVTEERAMPGAPDQRHPAAAGRRLGRAVRLDHAMAAFASVCDEDLTAGRPSAIASCSAPRRRAVRLGAAGDPRPGRGRPAGPRRLSPVCMVHRPPGGSAHGRNPVEAVHPRLACGGDARPPGPWHLRPYRAHRRARGAAAGGHDGLSTSRASTARSSTRAWPRGTPATSCARARGCWPSRSCRWWPPLRRPTSGRGPRRGSGAT